MHDQTVQVDRELAMSRSRECGELLLGEQPGLDPAGELDLLGGGEQRDPADLAQVLAEEVGGRAGGVRTGRARVLFRRGFGLGYGSGVRPGVRVDVEAVRPGVGIGIGAEPGSAGPRRGRPARVSGPGTGRPVRAPGGPSASGCGGARRVLPLPPGLGRPGRGDLRCGRASGRHATTSATLGRVGSSVGIWISDRALDLRGDDRRR